MQYVPDRSGSLRGSGHIEEPGDGLPGRHLVMRLDEDPRRVRGLTRCLGEGGTDPAARGGRVRAAWEDAQARSAHGIRETESPDDLLDDGSVRTRGCDARVAGEREDLQATGGDRLFRGRHLRFRHVQMHPRIGMEAEFQPVTAIAGRDGDRLAQRLPGHAQRAHSEFHQAILARQAAVTGWLSGTPLLSTTCPAAVA
jgi:hypothetical protein